MGAVKIRESAGRRHLQVMRGWPVLALLGIAHAATAADTSYFGLLRARDLSPFALLRLDMRPAHAISAEAGSWGVETNLEYQNTWALSPEVKRYLTAFAARSTLGPGDLQAIRNLPGENYLFDMEIAEFDVSVHRKLTHDWGVYAIFSGISYDGGFLDSTIERFHRSFGFETFGRNGVQRNGVNVIYDLKTAQFATYSSPIRGGLLDPNFGVRYTGTPMPEHWSLTLESAVKVPVGGRRPFLSTGRADIGVQATLRHLAKKHAWHFSASAVYYDGRTSLTPTPPQVLKTFVLGYERVLTSRTHLTLQGYASESPYTHRQTDLQELLARKYQLSLGISHRRKHGLWSVAFTENLENVDNTPDIGVQLSWAFSPAFAEH